MPVILGMATWSAQATDIDPRAYSNIPKNLNFVVLGYGNTKGNIAFSPALKIDNAKLETHSAVLAYSRSMDFWGKSGKIDFILPAAWLSGTAEVAGVPRERSVNGLTDAVARVYVNLYGAPSLSMKDFVNYKQDTIIGLSFAVGAATGQYNPDKLVNLGTNRWYFKPEIGVSKAWGPITTEFAASMFNFTDNDQPFHGGTLTQRPLYNMQGHIIYNFAPGVWGAFDADYYMGGGTTMDGREANNMLQNWRVGGTFSFPVSKQISIKLNGSTGVYSRTGSSFDIIGVAFQYRWGDGL
ncbi:MAG: transporter [Methylococcales bacterium]|nr:transporter [Methylococcales bacterium]